MDTTARKLFCGHCHECGCVLQLTLAGVEWCPVCRESKHYASHECQTCEIDRDAACPVSLVPTGQAARFMRDALARIGDEAAHTV